MFLEKASLRFKLVIIAAHTIAYLIAGGISYQLVTKEIWEGPDSILSFYLRTPHYVELWNFAMIWQIPGQIIRAFLIALVLLPIHEVLKQWSGFRKFWFFAGLLFVLPHLSAAAPSPANIEGLVYLKPEFIQLGFIKMQFEMILYSIIAGLIFSRYIYTK